MSNHVQSMQVSPHYQRMTLSWPSHLPTHAHTPTYLESYHTHTLPHTHTHTWSHVWPMWVSPYYQRSRITLSRPSHLPHTHIPHTYPELYHTHLHPPIQNLIYSLKIGEKINICPEGRGIHQNKFPGGGGGVLCNPFVRICGGVVILIVQRGVGIKQNCWPPSLPGQILEQP